MTKIVAEQTRKALPADKVAEAVEHALTAARPRPSYVIGREARISLVLSRVLPARAMDALIARFIGI